MSRDAPFLAIWMVFKTDDDHSVTCHAPAPATVAILLADL
jgi:hypothetical protein